MKPVDYKVGLSAPQTQFTQVQARQAPDSGWREKALEGVAVAAKAGGQAYAESKGVEMTGAEGSLAEVNEQADTIEKSIEAGLGEQMDAAAGPLQERDIEEIKDRELSKFTTDDRTLKELRDRGTISTIEARARRQLNLRRALSNPVLSMFKKDFLNASGDMTGGGKGAAAALFPYTMEEETAMAIAEETRKKKAEHESKVFDIIQKTNQPEEFVRSQVAKEEISRQKLAEYESIKTERALNDFELEDYQSQQEASATRGMTLQISTLVSQDGGKGLGATSSVNATRTLEYQYNGMRESILNTEGVDHKKALEKLDTWKKGMGTFIAAHSESTYNKDLVEALKQKAVVANWEAAPQMMALASTYPEFAKIYLESAGQVENRLELIMGKKGYAQWTAKVGDIYGEMGKFQNGEAADPNSIGAFSDEKSLDYLAKRASEDPKVRTNLLKAYNDASATSLRTYNSINAMRTAPKNEQFRTQIGEAMSVIRDKTETMKKLTGNKDSVIFASADDMSRHQLLGGRESAVTLDIPDNMLEYKDDFIEMYRTVAAHPWAWEHAKEDYIDSADAFNGYLRGEWNVDPSMGKDEIKGHIKLEIPPRAETLPPPDDTADTTLIRDSDRQDLMKLIETDGEITEEDEAKLQKLLDQRVAIRDKPRQLASPNKPAPIQTADAMSKAKPTMAKFAKEDFKEKLKSFENSKELPSDRSGWDGSAWKPHKSIEGGTDTLAYGHKLTGAEVKSGTVKIGSEEVDYKAGLTDEQAENLFSQDVGKHEEIVTKAYPTLMGKTKEAITMMVYQGANVTKWKNSSAAIKKAIKSDDDTDWLTAQAHILNSKWATEQTPERALETVHLMYPDTPMEVLAQIQQGYMAKRGVKSA